MTTTRNRSVAPALLVSGAVVFGMVLAGGLGLTVPGATDPEKANLSATKLASANLSSTRGLPSFADLAEAVDPAVVSIQAATIEKAPAMRRQRRQRGGGGGNGGSDPFEFFFGPRPRQGPQGQDGGDEQGGQGGQPEDYRSDAGGSGFVISPDGLVVTNYHVVEGATEVKVRLDDRDYTAKVKGIDPNTDIALLKIEAGHPLRYLELGDSDRLRVGDWVMVVGNPLNLDKTVTTGVVSAKGRSLGISDIAFENFIQTDAAINFGNSGGPLIDLQGQVVAIATAINYGAENIGFAVPVNTLKEILPQLREKGKVSRGYLGVQIGNLTYNQAQAFGLKSTNGALVGGVDKGTPASDAGIRHGDIIVTVDGRQVKTTRDLINYVSAKGPQATVTLGVLREGKELDRKVRLGERPALKQQQEGEDRPESGSGINWLGLQYQDLSSNLRQMYGLPNESSGVLITNVGPASPLYDQGVRPGSIISEVNGQEVKNGAGFEKLVQEAKPKSYLRLYVLRFDRSGRALTPFYAVAQVP
ncbi:MAG: Do family serine endopeptidase [Acidobacteriota bacterium]|nr:Do family serine endopeptidase [Acidobacteriota bacterium]